MTPLVLVAANAEYTKGEFYQNRYKECVYVWFCLKTHDGVTVSTSLVCCVHQDDLNKTLEMPGKPQ